MTPVKNKLFSARIYDKESFEEANKTYNFDIEYQEQNLSLKNAALTKDTDVVCVFVNDVINSELIDVLVANGVKILALRCAGYNNVDIHSAANRLKIVRVPSYSPYSVAEYALAMILALNRKIYRAYYRTKEDNFTLHGLKGFEMRGRTIGIVGTGQIARALIPTLIAMGMNVLGFDPFPDSAFAEKTGMKYVSLDELYAKSDIITLHCPLTDKNYHMISTASIQQMKDGVMIINTGRGKLINTKDLIEGIKTHKVGAAGLDVYEEEENYFYEDKSDSIIDDDDLARLLSFNNVIVTSHQGFFTNEALHNIAHTTLENIRLGIVEKLFPNIVQ